MKRCSNCGSTRVRIKFVKRTSEGAEAGKFLLAIFTAGISTLFPKTDLNKRWGNKACCLDCGYEKWTARSWLFNEEPDDY